MGCRWRACAFVLVARFRVAARSTRDIRSANRAWRGALDGWAGIYYALQRGVAEAVLALKLLEARLASRQEKQQHD